MSPASLQAIGTSVEYRKGERSWVGAFATDTEQKVLSTVPSKSAEYRLMCPSFQAQGAGIVSSRWKGAEKVSSAQEESIDEDFSGMCLFLWLQSRWSFFRCVRVFWERCSPRNGFGRKDWEFWFHWVKWVSGWPLPGSLAKVAYFVEFYKLLYCPMFVPCNRSFLLLLQINRPVTQDVVWGTLVDVWKKFGRCRCAVNASWRSLVQAPTRSNDIGKLAKRPYYLQKVKKV